MCDPGTRELLDPFKVGKGLRQSYALSPVLFNSALECVLRRIPQRQAIELNENHTPNIHGRYNNFGRYKYTVNSMSDLMNICKHLGLSINQENTKYMFMTREV